MGGSSPSWSMGMRPSHALPHCSRERERPYSRRPRRDGSHAIVLVEAAGPAEMLVVAATCMARGNGGGVGEAVKDLPRRTVRRPPSRTPPSESWGCWGGSSAPAAHPSGLKPQSCATQSVRTPHTSRLQRTSWKEKTGFRHCRIGRAFLLLPSRNQSQRKGHAGGLAHWD